ncbi:unnamed protein product [Thlaspi arvense]|uniref:Uncharacterized protein n=1 Tax=Thlaspi arvense TaxID=13288 RepID=A0AAU9RXB4_THLAR|nr:unnamed protein product [Thlaspi arvense]
MRKFTPRFGVGILIWWILVLEML